MLSLLSLLLSPLRSSLPRRYSGWPHRRIDVTALLEARTIYRGSHYCSHLNFKHTVIIRRIVTISLFGLDAMHDAICPIAPLPSWSSLHYLYTNRSTMLSHYLPLRLSSNSSKRLAGEKVTRSSYLILAAFYEVVLLLAISILICHDTDSMRILKDCNFWFCWGIKTFQAK